MRCPFLVLKATSEKSDVILQTYQTALLVLILAFTHLVNVLTVLMNIYQKCHCVNILQSHSYSKYLVKIIMIWSCVAQSLHLWSAIVET